MKPSWKEKNGFLVGTPTQNRAMALTGSAFGGCLQCTIQTEMRFLNNEGTISVIGWYFDKDNYIELIAREEANKWVLKQRSGGQVVIKAKGRKAIQTNQTYTVRIEFNGSQFRVFVDDPINPLFTMTPAGQVNSGQAGFEAKNTIGKFGYIQIE